MPIITITADTFFIQHETLESRRPVRELRGLGRITQQGDELCHVTFDLVEFTRRDASAREFHGSLELTGGVPLNVGLPNLILDLPDGRRGPIEVTSLTRNERREVSGVRGSLASA